MAILNYLRMQLLAVALASLMICSGVALPLDYEVPASNDLWTYKGAFDLYDVAFLKFIQFDDKPDETHLLLSEFSAIPFAKGHVYLASGVGDKVSAG